MYKRMISDKQCEELTFNLFLIKKYLENDEITKKDIKNIKELIDKSIKTLDNSRMIYLINPINGGSNPNDSDICKANKSYRYLYGEF